MSPRTGRPRLGEEPKNKQIAFRVTETTIKKFDECSKLTGRNKVDLFEEMVQKLYASLEPK